MAAIGAVLLLATGCSSGTGGEAKKVTLGSMLGVNHAAPDYTSVMQ